MNAIENNSNVSTMMKMLDIMANDGKRKKSRTLEVEKKAKKKVQSSTQSVINNSKRGSKTANSNRLKSIESSTRTPRTKRKEKKRESGKRKKSKRSWRKDRVLVKFYEKLKSKIGGGNRAAAPRTVVNEESYLCPQEISKSIDVPAEYGLEEKTAVSYELPELNNENNGQLFIHNVPFWALKTELPPITENATTTSIIKDFADGKWALLKALEEPKDFDEFETLDVLMSRDADYFLTPNRVLSNTIRSLVILQESMIVGPQKLASSETWVLSPKKTSPARSPTKIPQFAEPTTQFVYDRKNPRSEDRIEISFVPDKAKKVRKKKMISTRFNDKFPLS